MNPTSVLKNIERGLTMTKLRKLTIAFVLTSAISMSGVVAYAAVPSPPVMTDATNRMTTGNQAGLLANPGVNGSSTLSGTGTGASTPLTGSQMDTTPRTGVGAGIGGNIGGMGAGIGAQLGGNGTGIGANVGGVGVGIGAGRGADTGVMDNSRNNNKQMMDRMTTRGNGVTGGTGTGNYDTTPIRNYGVNAAATRTMNWGWLGLIGLFGLAGIRGNNRIQGRNERSK